MLDYSVQVQGYHIDYEDWHHDVHGKLPYGELIHKDPELRRILLSMPYPKLIFTNADIKHARRVLGILGIQDLFEVNHCAVHLGYINRMLMYRTRDD